MSKLTGWIVEHDYCAARYLAGKPQTLENKIAFIEKSPRVRFKPFTKERDWDNWEYGNKGRGGDYTKEEVYGFYKPSRDWCDKRLVEMGYEL